MHFSRQHSERLRQSRGICTQRVQNVSINPGRAGGIQMHSVRQVRNAYVVVGDQSKAGRQGQVAKLLSDNSDPRIDCLVGSHARQRQNDTRVWEVVTQGTTRILAGGGKGSFERVAHVTSVIYPRMHQHHFVIRGSTNQASPNSRCQRRP